MLDNYRPISILPVVSKLMERVLYDQMFDHLKKNRIFFRNVSLVLDNIILQLLHFQIVPMNGMLTWTVAYIT